METERIRLALETMAAPLRAIFERVREGRGYREIGDELGIGADEVERGFALALAHIDRVCERDPSCFRRPPYS